MRRRAMVYTVDMMVSVIFFMVIIASMLWVWGQSQNAISQYDNRMERMEKLIYIGQSLVTTSGRPANWHESGPFDSEGVKALGLAHSPNELSHGRLERLESMEYEDLRIILGLGAQDFHISIEHNWSGESVILYEAGQHLDAQQIMVAERFALLNETPVRMRIRLYEGG